MLAPGVRRLYRSEAAATCRGEADKLGAAKLACEAPGLFGPRLERPPKIGALTLATLEDSARRVFTGAAGGVGGASYRLRRGMTENLNMPGISQGKIREKKDAIRLHVEDRLEAS